MNSPTRVYVAASWFRKAEMVGVQERLEREGYKVVSTWPNEPDGPHHTQDTVRYTDAYLEDVAVRDKHEIQSCDVLLFFANNPKTPQIGGGRHFELGYATGQGKDVIIVGSAEHVFWHLPEFMHASTWRDVLNHLRTVDLKKPLPLTQTAFFVLNPEPVRNVGD